MAMTRHLRWGQLQGALKALPCGLVASRADLTSAAGSYRPSSVGFFRDLFLEPQATIYK